MTPIQYEQAFSAQIRRESLENSDSGFDYYGEGIKALNLSGDENILVIASGDGYMEKRLRLEHGHTGPITALEIPSSDRRDFEARFTVADNDLSRAGAQGFDKITGVMEALPLPDNSIDVVVLDHGIYHSTAPLKTLVQIQRVLVPGGKSLIRSNGANNKPELHRHLRYLARHLDNRAPVPFSSRFNMQRLLQVAPHYLSCERELVQNDTKTIDAEDKVTLYLLALDSYRSSFKTSIAFKDWDRGRALVERELFDRIDTGMPVVEKIERGGGVYVNSLKRSFTGRVASSARLSDESILSRFFD